MQNYITGYVRALTTAALFIVPMTTASAQGNADAARVLRDITTLAADKWEGRSTCSPGNDSAAAYISARFLSLGLEPAGSRTSGGMREFYHRYVARPVKGVTAPGAIVSCTSQNVAGMIKGTDPALADQYVIIGAHYDHLERNSPNATDVDKKGEIHNGADDNASGTAGVMELARLFKARPTKRSLIFVTFSGEEWGTLGSQAFVGNGLPTGHVQAMVNFDMIGRMRGDSLLVFGIGTAAPLRGIVDSANTGKLIVRYNPAGNGPSDHSKFYEGRMPVLHFFTDPHSDYHAASDDAAKINGAGEAKLLDLAARTIRGIADRRDTLAFLQVEMPKPAAPPSSGARPYLGSSPDMAGSDIAGLRISSVTPGSPGDKGGLKGGDVVVEFAGLAVTDIQKYSDALSSKKPGDTVTIVVLRDGKRVSLTVTLGVRGQ